MLGPAKWTAIRRMEHTRSFPHSSASLAATKPPDGTSIFPCAPPNHSPCRVRATGQPAHVTRRDLHHELHSQALQLRGMPRQPQPECAPDHAPRAAACRHRRRSWMAHPSLQMSNPIRISSRAIQCRADAEGATEYAIRYGGRDFIVTAHSRLEADATASQWKPEQQDDTQTELLK